MAEGIVPQNIPYNAPIPIANAQDYNTLPIGIVYNQGVGNNCPTETGYIVVITIGFGNAGQNECAQFGIDMYNGNSTLWYRTKVNKVWRSWVKL